MNDILKQRLVGALILVALGVVFWPIIFVEPGTRVEPGQVTIPPRPAVDTTPITAPRADQWRISTEISDEEAQADTATDDAVLVLPEPDAEVEARQETEKPEPAAPRSSAPQTPALDANGVPLAWSLQIASVSSVAKAEALRDQLLAMHEKAYIRKLERGDRDLYRVYIGPKFERAQLEQIQADIDTRFGVKSLIVRYLP